MALQSSAIDEYFAGGRDGHPLLILDQQWLFPVTAAIGGVALCYSTLGGLRAVVVTDATAARKSLLITLESPV